MGLASFDISRSGPMSGLHSYHIPAPIPPNPNTLIAIGCTQTHGVFLTPPCELHPFAQGGG